MQITQKRMLRTMAGWNALLLVLIGAHSTVPTSSGEPSTVLITFIFTRTSASCRVDRSETHLFILELCDKSAKTSKSNLDSVLKIRFLKED